MLLDEFLLENESMEEFAKRIGEWMPHMRSKDYVCLEVTGCEDLDRLREINAFLCNSFHVRIHRVSAHLEEINTLNIRKYARLLCFAGSKVCALELEYEGNNEQRCLRVWEHIVALQAPNLTHIRINAAGFKNTNALFRGISENPHITCLELDLGGNRSVLSELIPTLSQSHLTELKLCVRTSMLEGLMLELPRSKITCLDLSYSTLRGKAGEHLSMLLPSTIKSLDLSCCNIASNDIGLLLTRLPAMDMESLVLCELHLPLVDLTRQMQCGGGNHLQHLCVFECESMQQDKLIELIEVIKHHTTITSFRTSNVNEHVLESLACWYSLLRLNIMCEGDMNFDQLLHIMLPALRHRNSKLIELQVTGLDDDNNGMDDSQCVMDQIIMERSMFALLSARELPRISKLSALKFLPSELSRLVWNML